MRSRKHSARTPRESALIRARYGRWALVAGASESVGRAFAPQPASLGFDQADGLAGHMSDYRVVHDSFVAASMEHRR